MATPAIAMVRSKLLAGDIKRLTAEVAYARIVSAVDGAEAAYRIAAPVAALLETRLLDAAMARGELLRYGPAFSTSFAAMVDLALAAHHDEAAFRALQLANLSEIALVSTAVAARAAADNPASATLLRRLQAAVQARQTLDRTRPFAAAANDAPGRQRLDLALQAADAQIAALGTALDAAFPAFRRLGSPAPVSPDAFRAQLGSNEVLLAPLPTDDGTLAIAVSRAGFEWRKTPVPRFAVNTLIVRFRSSVDAALIAHAASFDTVAATARYAALVPPRLASIRERHADLVYCASGQLAALSPALLLTAPAHRLAGRGLADAAWLIRTHSIRVVPALSLTTVSSVAVVPGSFLGIGAPVAGERASAVLSEFRGGAVDRGAIDRLPALPGATAELRRMAAGLRSVDPLLLLGPQPPRPDCAPPSGRRSQRLLSPRTASARAR